MIKGFRDFLMRGNIVDIAVGFVVGAAFAAVVKAFADGVLGGLIGAIGGTPNLGNAGFPLNHSKVVVGPTLTALFSFFIAAAAIYFFVVVPMNRLEELRRRGEEPQTVPPPEDIELLREIRDLLRAGAGSRARDASGSRAADDLISAYDRARAGYGANPAPDGQR